MFYDNRQGEATIRKQTITAQSTQEAEITAANEAARHAVWISDLLKEIGYSDLPVRVSGDNQGANSSSNGSVYRPRNKHMGTRLCGRIDMLAGMKVQAHYILARL